MYLLKPKYRRSGGRYTQAKNWAVKFRHNGRQVVKGLGTPNKAAAEVRAKRLIGQAKDLGWEVIKPTLPGARKTDLDELIKLYKEFGFTRARPLAYRTIQDNILCLQRIARTLDLTRVEDLNGRLTEFLNKKEIMALSAQMRARISRSAASVFSREALYFYRGRGYKFENPFLGQKPRTPPVVPFTGFSFDRIGKLINAAKKDLKRKSPELYGLFLMALCGGLRAQEAAWARWENLTDTGIMVTSDELHQTKSYRPRFVPMPTSVVAEIKSLPRHGRFIIGGISLSRRARRRGDDQLRDLAAWLRRKGIQDQKPVHYLRKLFGAALATRHGLYAAKEYLGHTTVQVTESHYAALLDKPTVDFLK